MAFSKSSSGGLFHWLRAHPRYATTAAILCLPLVAFTALTVHFLAVNAPAYAAAERRRVNAEYRQQLQDFLEDGAPSFAVVRDKGGDWEPRGKRKPGVWGLLTRMPDGAALAPDEIVLWYDDRGGSVRAWRSKRIEPDGLIGALGIVLGGVLIGLVIATVAGILFFLRYAKARDDFMAATAHDLKTPLVALRLRLRNGDAAARQLVERLLRIVGNLGDFLRLGGRLRAPERTRFTVGAAFDEAYRVFADDFAEEKGGPVTLSTGRDLAVWADETMTVQILWNLLGNDLKYAAPHGPVTVVATQRGGFVDVVISDVGPGMTAHARRHAFDRYYRARTVLESGKGGFGIGLATAREFARAMGGDLTVGPNAPHGCVFTLALPSAS